MTERPERPDPLDRLDVFGRVDPPQQWDDIVRRVGEPEATPLRAVEPAERRALWVPAAAAAAVLVVAGGVLIAVNRGDDGQISTLTNPPSTVSATTGPRIPTTVNNEPVTTAPATVAAVTTEPMPTAPPTAPPTTAPLFEAPPLVPSCNEIFPVAPVSAGASYDAFGPLGAAPALEITLPIAPDAGLRTGSEVHGMARVAGGTVMLLRPDASSTAWQLVVLDDDGSVRWRRCGSESAYELLVGAEGSVVHVKETAADWSAWRAFDTADGFDATPLAADPAFYTVSLTERYVLLAGPLDTGNLQLVDLRTGTVTSVPHPGITLEGGSPAPLALVEQDDGSAVVAAGEYIGATYAVFVDSEWRTDRSSLYGHVGLNASEILDVDGRRAGVFAVDALGAQAWFVATEGQLPGEGFHVAAYDDVVVANVCRDGDIQAFTCDVAAMIGLDLATGEQLWERPGFGAVGPAGDGYAIVTTDQGWEMIELRTGEIVPGQVWDDEFAFSTFCCGEEGYVRAERDGGVAWAINYRTVRIYLPEAVAGPTVRVDLGR